MINERQAHKFCKDDISKIENYDKAIADTTQTWICHHILGEILTSEQLKDHDFYYDVPPCMLKFVTKAEHNSLHNQGKHHSEETLRKISEANKGKLKGVPKSPEQRRKISEALKGKHLSNETRRKISEATKRRLAATKK